MVGIICPTKKWTWWRSGDVASGSSIWQGSSNATIEKRNCGCLDPTRWVYASCWAGDWCRIWSCVCTLFTLFARLIVVVIVAVVIIGMLILARVVIGWFPKDILFKYRGFRHQMATHLKHGCFRLLIYQLLNYSRKGNEVYAIYIVISCLLKPSNGRYTLVYILLLVCCRPYACSALNLTPLHSINKTQKNRLDAKLGIL